MSRHLGMVCASTLLFALTGCSGGSFLTSAANPAGHKQVVAGSIDQVSTLLETGLSEAGVTVLTKRLNGEIRLAGMTKSEKVFCLYVKRQETDGGPKSAVTIRWDRQSDDPFWQNVVAILSAGNTAREAP
jgi:hypothetical protein